MGTARTDEFRKDAVRIALTPWAVGQLSMKETQAGGEAEVWAHMRAATVFMVLPVLFGVAYIQRSLGELLDWRTKSRSAFGIREVYSRIKPFAQVAELPGQSALTAATAATNSSSHG